MTGKFGKAIIKIFGSRSQRLFKHYLVPANRAGRFEEQVKQLNDEQLKAKTAEFKQAISGGTNPEDLLPEAFAVVREAARRNRVGPGTALLHQHTIIDVFTDRRYRLFTLPSRQKLHPGIGGP